MMLNFVFESVWCLLLLIVKFMILFFDVFLCLFCMCVFLIGFGDSVAACKYGCSVGAYILR